MRSMRRGVLLFLLIITVLTGLQAETKEIDLFAMTLKEFVSFGMNSADVFSCGYVFAILAVARYDTTAIPAGYVEKLVKDGGRALVLRMFDAAKTTPNKTILAFLQDELSARRSSL